MATKVQQISVFLLGIFLFVIGFQSFHVVEHYQLDAQEHKCSSHQHNSEKNDCSICDFTFSSALEFVVFSFNCINHSFINTKVTEIEFSVASVYHPCYFSLRAPPLD